MKVVHHWLFIIAGPCRSAVAFPLAYASTEAYVPMLAISISLFLFIAVFLAVKLVYMKHRRIGTIHAPSAIPASCRGKRTSRHGLVVGCLGSPTWETHLTSRFWRRQQRRRSSFTYQLHARSMTSTRSKSKNSASRSPFTRTAALASYSSHADHVVLPSSTRSSRITQYDGDSALASSQRSISTNRYSRYGDFGEFHAARLPGGGLPSTTRRASPSSIRLVDGPSHSNQVEYSFLSALPPNAMAASPLMGTRDSFQLSRCSLKSNRKPAPPLPSLPAFLPFHVPRDPESETVDSRSQQSREYLPRFHFSPLASIAKVFHSPQQAIEESPLPVFAASGTTCLESSSSSKTLVAASPTSSWVIQEVPTLHPIHQTDTKYRHKRSQSHRGLAIEGSLSRTSLVINVVPVMPLEDKRRCVAEPTQTSVLCTPSGSSHTGSVASNKPLKSCLRQPSGVPVTPASSPDTVPTPSMLDASSPTYRTSTRQSTDDQASIRTPLTEDDIGMLGLDRFRWNDDVKELKLRSSHMKKDSVALVPLWE